MRLRRILLLVLFAAPAAARPDAPDESGVLLGLRAGYGVPFGDVERDAAAVREVADEKLPLWLELGYRFNPRVQGAIFFELAPARVASERCTDGGCDASHVRFGVAVQLHLAPGARLDPWIGAGIGIEVLRAEIDDPGATPVRRELTWAGLELPVAEAGVDVRMSRRFSLGPYLSASFGQFTSRSERPEGGSSARDPIEDRERHGWIQAGLKATILL
jgi:hypothetical protein